MPIENQSDREWRDAKTWLWLLAGMVIPILFALLNEAIAGDIYKCGRTYADQPCGPEAVKLASPASQPSVPRSASIAPGWTEQAARAALEQDGLYFRVHVLESGVSIYKQFAIGRHAETRWYLYTRDGVVTSVLW